MAQLFDIKRVTVGPRNLEAEVEISPSAPLMTSDDPEGTERVLALIPELEGHLCLGDASSSFGEVVANTELAHLLEHVTVELLARTDRAGDVSSGQTVGLGERLYKITLACPDDVLVAGALSSAVWILQWAYAGGGDPRPDVDAIASGLAALVESLTPAEEATEPAAEPVDAGGPEQMAFDEPAPAAEPEPEPAPLFADDDVPAPEPEPVIDAEPESAPEPEPDPAASAARDAWDLGDVPRPHLVR